MSLSETPQHEIHAQRWAVVATYSYPYEAQIARARLIAEEIPARIENEHTINMYWLYSNAMGGVRLMVIAEYAAMAREIIAQDFSEDVEQQFKIKADCCPQCGSDQVAAYTQGKKPAFLVFLLLGYPLFFYKHGMRCEQCHYFYTGQAS